MGIVSKIFGTHSQHELKRIKKTVDKIESLQPEMKALSDEQLRGKTAEFKQRLADGATLDLDGLFDAPAADRPALSTKQAIVRAEGGIIGLPKAMSGTMTDQKHLIAVVEGNTLYVCRISGTTVTIR